MSDTPQGPGWWQASDDKWYPPPRPDMPDDYGTVPSSPPTEAPPAPPMGMTGMEASPYGGMPLAEGAPAPNRTPLYMAGGAVLVVVLLGLIFVLLQDDNGGDSADPGDDDNGPSEPTVEPRDLGNGIILVDYGVTMVEDTLYDDDVPSYAFVVENTGETQTALAFGVTLYDAEGAVVDHQTVPVGRLEAGQTFGVGKTYGSSFEDNQITREVTDLGVELGRGSGGPAADSTGSLTTSGITTSVSDDSVSVAFSITSEYDHQINNPVSHVLLRDTEGRLVGGMQAPEPSFIGPAGTAGASVTNRTSFGDVEIDPDRTEAFVDYGI